MAYSFIDAITAQYNRRQRARYERGEIPYMEKKSADEMQEDILMDYVVDEMPELLQLLAKWEERGDVAERALEEIAIEASETRRRLRAADILVKRSPNLYDYFKTGFFDDIATGHLLKALSDCSIKQPLFTDIVDAFRGELGDDPAKATARTVQAIEQGLI